MVIAAAGVLTAMTAEGATRRVKDTAPDFAYPEQVAKSSATELRRALKAGDDAAAVRAAIDLSLSRLSVSPVDSLAGQVSMIATTATQVKSPAAAAMLRLYQATMLADAYSMNSYRYDRRSMPLRPYAADPALWSSEQYRDTVRTLVGQALADGAALKKVALSDYRRVVAYEQDRLIFYPTVLDFATLRSIALLERVSAPHPGTNGEIMKLYDALVESNRGRTAALAYDMTARAEYVYGATEAGTADLNRMLGGVADSLADSEFSGLALLAMQYDYNKADELRGYYKRLQDYADRFRTSMLGGAIDCELARISLPEARVEYPAYFAALTPVKLRVTGRNVGRATVEVYRVGDNEKNPTVGGLKLRKPVVSVPVEFPVGAVPFDVDTTVTIEFPGEGAYAAIVRSEYLTASGKTQVPVGRAISIAAYGLESSKIVAVDPTNGAPVAGATVMVRKNGTMVKAAGNLLTDGLGMATLKNGGSYCVMRDGHRSNEAYYNVYKPARDDDWNYRVAPMVNLPLYHPGDSVLWAAVTYRMKGQHQETVAGKKLTAELYDANNQVVASDTVKSDATGRVEGGFELPGDGLTGYYRLQLRFAEENGGHQLSGMTVFMVSDYKLPTFEVDSLKAVRNQPAAGAVTLVARAMTYSGMPVAGGEATVTLYSARSWWAGRYGDRRQFYSATAKVGDDGLVEVAVPADVMASAPYRNGSFFWTIAVTSASGESQSGASGFTDGPSYHIEVEGLREAVDGKRGADVKFVLTDNEDRRSELPITVRLTGADGTVVDKTAPASQQQIDFKAVASGDYRLTAWTAGGENCDTLSRRVVVYRPGDKKSPVEDARLWSPDNEMTVSTGQEAEIVYALSRPDNHILVTIAGIDGVIEQKYVHKGAGVHTLKVAVPDTLPGVTVVMSGVIDYGAVSRRWEVSRREAKPEVKITAGVTRDRLTPGSVERLTFKVTDINGRGVEAAVIADMYNRALSSLAGPQRLGGFERPATMPYIDVTQFVNTLPTWRFVTFKGAQGNCDTNFDVGNPTFETYGLTYGTGRGRRLYIRGRAMASMASANTMSVDAAGVTDEAMVVEREAKKADAGAADVTEEEVAAPAAPSAPAEGEGPAEVGYRDAEVTSAFFRPMLMTDKEGNLEIAFTVPNANASWTMNALAFTRELAAGDYTTTMVSSKPVMVQPNLPRFVRSGDRVVIAASVMNATDKAQSVEVEIEITDAMSGDVLASESKAVETAAGGNAVVTTAVTAPGAGRLLRYRIKGATEGFYDAEQAMIPVLESSMPVIDTEMFAIAPGEDSCTVTVPAHDGDATVTLTFCENPSWEVVKALPGLLDSEATTSTGAATVVYSAAVALGLMRDYPAVARELERWLASDRGDSTLVSMLNRNNDLKLMVLNSTPWIGAAASDTERMTRLALLFDKKALSNNIAAAAATLKKLQNDDGGLRWGPWGLGESSEWATTAVLQALGALKERGWLPDVNGLESLMGRAVRYIDRETVKEYGKNSDGDYSWWLYTRSSYRDVAMSAGAEKVKNVTLQRLIGGWRKMSLTGKAEAATVLARYGHTAVARSIMASVEEFSVYKPERGRWWPKLVDGSYCRYTPQTATAELLDAFAEIEPTSRVAAEVAQWLIMEKTAQDWGRSIGTTSTVAAVLRAGSRYMQVPAGATVTVDGKALELTPLDRATGTIRAELSGVAGAGSRVTVKREGDVPSWGAIYTRYTARMDEITASGSDELRIDRRYYRVNADGSLEATSDFNVGDRVAVELTVEVARDIDYVAISDTRAACFEPVEQMPGTMWQDGLMFYRENRDAVTNIFVDRLRKGSYRLRYDVWVNNAGRFVAGDAAVQSQYAPAWNAHSGGSAVRVAE